MFGHPDYYNEERAHKLIRALFSWVKLDSHDKKCWNHVMGLSSTSTDPEGAATQKEQREDAHRNSACEEPESKTTSTTASYMAGLESALSEISLGKPGDRQCMLLHDTSRAESCLPSAFPVPADLEVSSVRRDKQVIILRHKYCFDPAAVRCHRGARVPQSCVTNRCVLSCQQPEAVQST